MGILGFMTGESVFTHQIPRISREAAPVLRRQLPQLAEAFDEADQVTPENYKALLDGWIARFGETHPVEPFTRDEHEYREPMSELVEKVRPDQIIVAPRSW